MANNDVLFADESPQMRSAYAEARRTFKYFWRELWWERRRIVPALDLACVKVAFRQDDPSGAPLVEHMWISDLEFDGCQVQGTLVNQPNDLTNIKQGDAVKIPYQEIDDWLFATRGKAYGGFTIQALRADMDPQERAQHDEAWGLDFGEPDKILVAYEQDEHPENLTEHPMSINMGESLKAFLSQHPQELTAIDAQGYTMLHRETIAGNTTCVEVLLQLGADRSAKTPSGQTALDFAKALAWEQLIPVLE